MSGIYPVWETVKHKQSTDDGGETWEERVITPGIVRHRQVTAGPWIEQRTDCFCCSCHPDGGGTDPYCRNHGHAGMRPCEAHGMPGQVNDDGDMPDAVQNVRRRQERAS